MAKTPARKTLTVKSPKGDPVKITDPGGPSPSGYITVLSAAGEKFRVENPHGAAVICSVTGKEHVVTPAERDDLGTGTFVSDEAIKDLEAQRKAAQAAAQAEAKDKVSRRSPELQAQIDQGSKA